jgi:hypothetical protein
VGFGVRSSDCSAAPLQSSADRVSLPDSKDAVVVFVDSVTRRLMGLDVKETQEESAGRVAWSTEYLGKEGIRVSVEKRGGAAPDDETASEGAGLEDAKRRGS